MKRFKIVLIITIFFSFSVSIVAASNRIALVIGNADYKSSPLTNPANDAMDIASNLELCGFEVIKRINASQRDMEKAVDTFYKKLKKADVGLFYYAGHGIQVDGRNYLIPVDAKVTSESDIKYESVDVGRVLGKMKDAGNNLNIVILDACRDNPFKRTFRSNSQGFAKMDAPGGSIIIYSTAPGSIAADGQGRNGLYTGFFLDNMMKEGFPIEKVLKETRKQVFKKTNGKQVPWDSSSLMGDFYFLPDKQKIEQAPDLTVLERKDVHGISESIQNLEPFPKITDKSDPYTKNKYGVVYDKLSGLEWYVGPDETLTWEQSQKWILNLAVDGNSWRMPRLEELKSLYIKGLGDKNMTPLLKTTGWGVWSVEKKDKDRPWFFSFHGGYVKWVNSGKTINGRTFAVRYKK